MIVLSVILGIAVFLCVVVAFSIGVKFGLTLKTGSQPKIEPVKTILHAVEERKETKEIQKKSEEVSNNIKNLFGYEGELKAKGVSK